MWGGVELFMAITPPKLELPELLVGGPGSRAERVPAVHAMAVWKLCARSPLTGTLHPLPQPPSASLRPRRLPQPAQQPLPLPHVLGGRQGGEAVSQPGWAEQGPASPLPDQIQFRSLMGLRGAGDAGLAPLLAGWVVPARHRVRSSRSRESPRLLRREWRGR